MWTDRIGSSFDILVCEAKMIMCHFLLRDQILGSSEKAMNESEKRLLRIQ